MGISLNASVRSNLLSLQSTARLLVDTQKKLATGKQINAPLDNATAYFQSQGFLNTASDLTSLKNNMATGLQTIAAASYAVEAIGAVVDQLKSIATTMAQTEDAVMRATYAAQYNGLLQQIDALAEDATFNGTNLVDGTSAALKINFNTSNTTSLTIGTTDLTASGLQLRQIYEGLVDGAQTVITTTTVADEADVAVTGTYSGTLSVNVAGATYTADGAFYRSTNDVDPLFNRGLSANFETIDTQTPGNPFFFGTHLSDMVDAGLLSITNGSPINEEPLLISALKGTFTVTGGADDTLAPDNISLYIGDGSSTVLTIAPNDTVMAVFRYASSPGITRTTTYQNISGHDVTFDIRGNGLGANSDYISDANVRTHTFATVPLSGGVIDYASLALTSGETLGGIPIIASDGYSVGTTETLTFRDTEPYLPSETTQTTQTYYDTSGASVTNIPHADIHQTYIDGVRQAGWSSTDATVSLTGAKLITATVTTTVKDSMALAQEQLAAASAKLRLTASALGTHNSLVQTREKFTTSLINTLQTASDNLVLADTNKEGAAMQVLQARNQLGIVSLKISGSLAQDILKLFG